MKKSAFTLMELLVSTSVIALLAGLALPVLSSVAQKGKLTNDLSHLHQLGLALQTYQNDNNSKMPPDQGGYFIVSAQATNQILLTYTGSNFGLWHSDFDPRVVAPGDASPVSYSINEKVLTPPGGTPTSEGWTGDLAVSVVPLSELLIASPSFSVENGAVSWGDNVASMVLALPNQGQGMFQTTPAVQPSYYSPIPSLFADSHVELVPIANYQCTSANSADWAQWDPMGPNDPATPIAATPLPPPPPAPPPLNVIWDPVPAPTPEPPPAPNPKPVPKRTDYRQG